MNLNTYILISLHNFIFPAIKDNPIGREKGGGRAEGSCKKGGWALVAFHTWRGGGAMIMRS